MTARPLSFRRRDSGGSALSSSHHRSREHSRPPHSSRARQACGRQSGSRLALTRCPASPIGRRCKTYRISDFRIQISDLKYLSSITYQLSLFRRCRNFFRRCWRDRCFRRPHRLGQDLLLRNLHRRARRPKALDHHNHHVTKRNESGRARMIDERKDAVILDKIGDQVVLPAETVHLKTVRERNKIRESLTAGVCRKPIEKRLPGLHRERNDLHIVACRSAKKYLIRFGVHCAFGPRKRIIHAILPCGIHILANKAGVNYPYRRNTLWII